VRAAVLVVGLVFVLSACGGDNAAGPAARTTARATTAAGLPVPPRCIVVPAAVVRAVASELRGNGRRLVSAQAVKTTAFSSVFFVSGKIRGAPSTPIGTWATNNLDIGGLIFSIDSVAKRFSKWGDGSKFDPKLTMKLDGARLSRTCTKRASG